ncbi:cystathionine beta-lyase [Telmatospirillum siberiense]|uniref:Cystathionine beta-lyase n=1 Tax=Telmatospirillum siberiense TaxID=382514 RepID=A0A2N3PZX0_9PROT|nr:cystathionine beta-lyase [Telmatospirillum siberiense]PKU25945.1 cystathionine beta-lyase [Telmatospirillum siberiense]
MKKDTKIVHAGRHPEQYHGAVNPPVYHVSTVTYPSVAAMTEAERKPYDGMRYGRYGTPTSFALEEAIAILEGGYRTISTASGLAAITGTLTALLKSGDHVLMVDTVYFPTRRFCTEHLKRCGIETTFYDPSIGAGISALMRPETRVVFVEAPGSLTFEMQDIPAIATVAHAGGAIVVMDNTWATPLFFKPFEKGVDISLQAATKFIVGHSDAMLGLITCATEELWHVVKSSIAHFGVCAGSEEVYLGLRGLRTLSVRLRQHQESGLALASWLAARPEVLRVMHPALPGDPGHALWKRDFSGACGLFGFELAPCPEAAVNAFIDGLEHFGLGYSWGGYESLIIPTSDGIKRTAKPWRGDGPTLRIHTGLEDPSDLIEDLAKGFDRLAAKK